MIDLMIHQYHYGKKFYICKSSGYWLSTSKPRIRAHVWVWKYHYGDIPKGKHIHHINGDKSDNRIENLNMMDASDHLSLHNSTLERKKRASEWIDKIRSLTKEWHSSIEGREWHRKHGIKTWEERKPFKINCLFCGKEIITKTYHQRFCHQNCKAKYARRLLKNKIN